MSSGEPLPSMSIRLVVISRDVNLLENCAFRLGVPFTISKNGIAQSDLVHLRVDNVSQQVFPSTLEEFTASMIDAIEKIGGERVLRDFDVAEVRLTIFSHGNINASAYLPTEMIGAIARFGLDLYFGAM